MTFALLLSILAGVPAPADAMAADAPAARAASGKWTVDYADNMCVLARRYGTGKDEVTVGFRPWPMGEMTDIVLINNHGATGGTIRGNDKYRAGVTLLPSGRTIQTVYNSWRPAKQPAARISTFLLSPDDLAAVIASGDITLTARGISPVRVMLAGTKPAMSALKTCAEDLLRTWKVDPAELEHVATPARAAANASAWITSNDYPLDAVVKNAEGAVGMVWEIDTNGLVTDCRVVNSSGTPALDETACRTMSKRARYTPAKDKAGRSIVSHQSMRVTFVMP